MENEKRRVSSRTVGRFMLWAASKDISDSRPSSLVRDSAGWGTKQELRILQVFNSLAMGGAETWLMALLRYFQQAQDELPVKVHVDVLLTGGVRTMFDNEAESLGARLFYSHFTRKNFFRFARDFRRILIEGRYHAIHDHQDYSAGLRFMMGHGRLPSVRVAHVHNTSIQVAGYNSSFLRRFTFARAKRFLARSATHVTSTSQRMLTEFGFDDPYFNSISRSVVHCGFDVSSFRGNNLDLHRQLSAEFGWENDAKIILFVGRLDDPAGPNLHRKRPDFALEVARACIAQDSQVRMIMAGSGQRIRTKLEGEVKSWGLEDKIRLTGIYPDVTRLMLGSDLFLFPAIEEGLGMVVVEAQAAGLRVLTSTGVPQESMVVPDIVEFKALEDGVSSWAKQALRLLNLPRPDSGACNSAVRDSAFSIENSAKKLLDIYCSSSCRGMMVFPA
jgi:glycosyltransferase involved in cell wall biosynthesis